MPHTKEFYNHVHNSILKTWKEDIKREYNDCYIPNEATLVNVFYLHLRRRLGEWDKIRIFTEHSVFIGDKFYKPDMVVVEIGKDEEDIKEIISVFEFKYPYKQDYKRAVEWDLSKIKEYAKSSELGKCRFYGVSIYVKKLEKINMLTDNAYKNWAKKVTELVACLENEDEWNRENNKMKFYVYNNEIKEKSET